MRKNNKFWEFRNSAGGGAELTLYGEISDKSWYGDEVTPKMFKSELDECEGDLTIFINSGGGDVFAGFTIYNMLARYEGKKTVHIDALAASIASVIAMAGDEIIMPENAMMMIHNAWTVCAGDKNELRKMADEVERIDGLIADTYARRGRKTGREYAEMMDAETWFTAQEALEAGLIDRTEAGRKAEACMREDGKYVLAGIEIDSARFLHKKPLQNMAEGARKGHSNGDEDQPVDDINALAKQRDKFNRTRLKIVEGENF